MSNAKQKQNDKYSDTISNKNIKRREKWFIKNKRTKIITFKFRRKEDFCFEQIIRRNNYRRIFQKRTTDDSIR